ncbi:MAG: putative metalloprotease CJM1_0395 family protein [Rhodospirillales bacterium]
MVSSVTLDSVDLALLSRGQAVVPLAAEAQAFLTGPSQSQQREAESPSLLELVQSTNSPVDGRTLVAAQETSNQNNQQSGQSFEQQNNGGDEKTTSSSNSNEQNDPEQSADGEKSPENGEGKATPANPQGLTEEEIQQVKKLKKIDREVRAHERAHQNAAPELTGPASYKTVRGPDGKLYAVAGEVSIDTGEAATPEATIQKLKRIIKAALAPLEPSAQDRQVAAQARAEIAEARSEIREEKAEEKQKAEESKDEREAQNQGNSTDNSNAALQPDLANAIQAFQAAAALSSANQPRTSFTSA